MLKHPFAIYRLPFANECTIIEQYSDSVETYDKISNLEGRSGFVMIPFSTESEKRIVLIRPDKIRRVNVEDLASEEVILCDEIGCLADYNKGIYENHSGNSTMRLIADNTKSLFCPDTAQKSTMATLWRPFSVRAKPIHA